MPIGLIDSVIFGRAFATDEIRSIFDEKSVVEGWLLFERTLAKVQADLGIIPREAAAEIDRKARPDLVSIESVRDHYARTGLASVALVRAVKELCSKQTGEYLHYGVTSQDLYDTGLAIRLKKFMGLLNGHIKALRNTLAKMALKHKETVMIGRTHGKQAVPLTFGFKMAVMAEAFNVHLKRADEIYPRICLGSVSGAVGTFSSFKAISDTVDPFELERRVLAELGLEAPPISIQPAIERLCELLNFLSLVSMSCEKLAQDFFTMQRDEIGEIREMLSADEISSSTMPHKQNPKACELIIGLSKMIRAYSHALAENPMKDERDKSAFVLEDLTIPHACVLTVAALRALKAMVEGLQVFPERMRENLHLTQGMIMAEKLMIAIARKTGRKESAHRLVTESAARASKEGIPFSAAVLENAGIRACLTPAEIKEALEPAGYVGLSKRIVEGLVDLYGPLE